jgi:hypothetical protein
VPRLVAQCLCALARSVCAEGAGRTTPTRASCCNTCGLLPARRPVRLPRYPRVDAASTANATSITHLKESLILRWRVDARQRSQQASAGLQAISNAQ